MKIYFIGYRGTGKTTLGRALACRWRAVHVDLDQAIQESLGSDRSIADVFAEEGEQAFRDLEAAKLAEVAESSAQVVSLGGGAILRDENRALLAATGHAIWLRASIETLVRRLGEDPNSPSLRPALTKANSLRDEIEQVLKLRTPIYESVADNIVDTDQLSIQQLVKQLDDQRRWLEAPVNRTS